jgi:uncharacterized protein YndB with AHSA1/START domain
VASLPDLHLDPDAIIREIRIEARPEIVFEYFVDPDRLVRWMGKHATLEPKPGGLFRVDYGPENGGVRGEFLAVERPSRVVFTWGWENSDDPIQPGQSTVEVTIRAVDGASHLTLRHSGLIGASRVSHDDGWAYFLPRLSEAVATDDA